MITLKIWHGPMRATLTLPLREAEIQKALVKAFHTAPFKVTADDMSPEALAMLNGKEIDLDELNFLAKSLDRFTPYEQDQFWAIVQMEQPSDLKALINLAFNMERYTLVQNVTDLAAVGKKYLLNKMGTLPASEIDNLDFEQAGRELLTSGDGTPTTYGLLFTNEDVPYREVYHGATFPYCEPRRDIIAVAKMEYGPKTEYLYLPEDELAIIKAARRMGAPSPDMCRVAFTDFMLDAPTWIQHLETMLCEHGLGVANELADAFPRTTEGFEKLAAVVEYADVSSSGEVMRIARHLEDFVFIKDAETDEDVGHHFVSFDSEYRASPELADYIDFDALGNQISEDREGQFVEGGFVCMDSGCSLEMILDDDLDLAMRGI
ncbi:hypothetical protein I5Q82_01495 [Acutalibacter muris]|uniref:Antirestriction protein ArdA n=1 Tax=Acutalibacter muris TaxID=1796620 RepID=A0A1Z2XRT8_9FIRM|nr:hypothetical protein [Acutalibacter muris]ANU55593.1 hypothetical protein A4V00_17130 [Hungateiclostridiaceae bacterium KB18]ASB41168.1 hypothetical protein ADH66_11180 [Acutalibacter muris]QQR30441.1 hypothetical protein I5Q82_01495 [Acutalibacter muris]